MTRKIDQEEISEEVTTSWDGKDESQLAMQFRRDSKPNQKREQDCGVEEGRPEWLGGHEVGGWFGALVRSDAGVSS